MSVHGNPFLLHLKNHPEAGTEEIKRLFRILAKRTHPDTGADDAAAFVELQRAYHEAMTEVMDRRGAGRAGAAGSDIWLPSTPRERVLHLLYRYKAHLPTITLSATPLPSACMKAFSGAIEAAGDYGLQYRQTLERYDEQFHRRRASISRYPDVMTKYSCFLRGLASVFDYILMPNDFNDRVARSYFSEIHPVTDYDPTTSPVLRTNRSAPARAALYRFSVWLLDEIQGDPCRIV